jgi:short-subunit dehydrogenase
VKLPVAVAATAGAAAVAALGRRPRREDDLRGEVAVVTGASRGLGLLLATELAQRGCRLLICARDQTELGRAASRLRDLGAEVAAVACDLTEEESASNLVQAAQQEYGRLDIMISNAGIIRVGPVQSTTPADYATALALMALAPARLALAALPVMQAQGHGRIVTITSLGGKVSVPHLLPYSTAKFAAVGFSEGLRAELGRGPVTVTTVVPGLMRTGSHVNAEFAGQRAGEFTWFGLGASLPVVSMDAERAARQIVAGVAQRRPEIFLTPAGQVVSRLAGVAPELTTAVLHAVQKLLLPAPDGDAGAVPGHRLRSVLPEPVFGALTSMGRAAAVRFNETRAAERP